MALRDPKASVTNSQFFFNRYISSFGAVYIHTIKVSGTAAMESMQWRERNNYLLRDNANKSNLICTLLIASGASYLVCSMPALSIYIYIYIIVRASIRKCTSLLNSEYNFQFYWRVINVQQYRVRRNPRAQRCSVF